MTAREVAERMIEHVVRNWDVIPDRENTIEQAILLMTNGIIRWTDVSNALIGKKIPPEVVKLMQRTVERLRNGEIKQGERTKTISEFTDACVNSQVAYELRR